MCEGLGATNVCGVARQPALRDRTVCGPLAVVFATNFSSSLFWRDASFGCEAV